MKEINVDVLIVGGGTAGVSAALAAADEGANVLLVESGGGIGGVGTYSGIHSYCYGLHVGMQREFDKEIKDIADILGSRAKGFHPEAKKIRLEEMLVEKGAAVLYDCLAVEVIMEQNKVVGVILESPDETCRVNARVTIDSTGNGDICALAGVPFEDGREWDGVNHVYSMTPRHIISEENVVGFMNFDAGWVDSSSTRDVSLALLEGRGLLADIPELQGSKFISTAAHFGAREGRHILGGYVLTMEDLILDQRFDDVVMKCFSTYDNHAKDLANENRFAQIWEGIMGGWSLRVGCDIPYRSFVPVGIDGLFIACRALSMDHDANMAFRMQPDMHAAGEVAGTAAVLGLKAGKSPRDLDVNVLQQRLVERGVLKQDDLSRESAPWVMLNGDKREARVWTLDSTKQPDIIQKLIEALGTEQEGKALWWLWKAGDAALPALKEALGQAEGYQRRGAAIALALLGNSAGVPYLIQSVADEDLDVLPGYERFVPPHWIASLLALRGLQDPSCVDMLLERLQPANPTERLWGFAQILHILQYIIEVSEHLSTEMRAKVLQKVKELLDEPDLGADWTSNRWTDISIRWNIEMTAAYLLVRLGEESGYAILDHYLQHERVFVQKMAHRLKSRLLSTLTNQVDEKVYQQ